MKVKLERFVNNGWYEYCTYDLTKESDIKAYTEAARKMPPFKVAYELP